MKYLRRCLPVLAILAAFGLCLVFTRQVGTLIAPPRAHEAAPTVAPGVSPSIATQARPAGGACAQALADLEERLFFGRPGETDGTAQAAPGLAQLYAETQGRLESIEARIAQPPRVVPIGPWETSAEAVPGAVRRPAAARRQAPGPLRGAKP
jgi:hypothetical protein